MAIDQITHRCPVSLCPRTTNPRTHSKKQIFQIAASIEQFGFVNPVLVDREDRIVAGHGRVEAAKQLGLKSVPTICLENLTDGEIRAYVIADNRLAELAGWRCRACRSRRSRHQTLTPSGPTTHPPPAVGSSG